MRFLQKVAKFFGPVVKIPSHIYMFMSPRAAYFFSVVLSYLNRSVCPTRFFVRHCQPLTTALMLLPTDLYGAGKLPRKSLANLLLIALVSQHLIQRPR